MCAHFTGMGTADRQDIARYIPKFAVSLVAEALVTLVASEMGQLRAVTVLALQ